MSALAMLLTVAMVVPEDGPEKVSGEMVRGLGLSGEWQGVLYHWGETYKGRGWIHEDGEFAFIYRKFGNIPFAAPAGLVQNEANGHIRIGEYMGIYEQHGDRLWMCLRVDGHQPTSFRIVNDNAQYLLILHRVKPRK